MASKSNQAEFDRKNPGKKVRRKWEEGTCPICKNDFKHGDCPHSFFEAQKEVEYQEFKDRLIKDLKAEGVI